jgi:tetratricopeptide (TPR) repeat protein
MAVQLFLSCVSDEFGAYREPLSRELTLPDVAVKIQEEFKPQGGDTLSMLKDYIAPSAALVHFVGDATGAKPPDSCVRALLTRYPDIATKLPPLGAALDAGKPVSYTQWEAWLALYLDKDMLIVVPARSQSNALQVEHLARLSAIDRYPGKPFVDMNDLAKQILASLVIPALKRAARESSAPGRQPRNLPFASLGALFKGREMALDDLRAAFMAGKGSAVTGWVLHGLGGIGKTQLAIEYAWSHQADYSALLFARADDRGTLNASLSALASAKVLDLAEKEAREDEVKIDAVLKWLDADRNQPWLLILDNVDDKEAVRAVVDLMAQVNGGHVIVTARAANFPVPLQTFELGVLDDLAASAFLMDRTRGKRAPAPDDAAQAGELAHELGGLALGLEQAGAYIAKQRIGFARYLKLWNDNRDKALAWSDAIMTGTEKTLATTWVTSVAQLSADSRRLLDRLAFFAPDPVPDSLLDVAVPGEAADYDAYEARAGLYAYSLASQAKGKRGVARGFVVHRLVQDFARRAIMERRRSKTLRGALKWVDAAFDGDPQDVRSWPALDPLAPHAIAVARWADEAAIANPTARLFNEIALLFEVKARYAEAEPLYGRALEIDEKSYGPNHPEVATDLNNLAELLRETNRLEEAEPLYRRALRIDETVYGRNHPSVATPLNNLALLLRAANRPSEAEPLFRRALRIDEDALGPNHPEVARDLNNLAELLRGTNRVGESEPLYRRALAIGEASSSLGPDHPQVARYLNNLGRLFRDTNRLDQAEPLIRRALKIDEASYGRVHPNVARDLYSLAKLLCEMDRPGKAEPLFRRALKINETSLGANHPSTVLVRKNLAAVLSAHVKGP